MTVTARLATADDRNEILALVREMIPGVDAAARWDWMYARNPAGHALTWLAIAADGAVAGCTSLFPWRLWLDGVPVLAALGGDGYVRPAYRRRGLGGLLHEASRAAMPAHGLACMYGAPGELNLTPLKHGGSRELGHVARWARPLRGSALKLPGALDGVVAAALRPRFVARLEPVVPLDDRVDAVWSTARQGLRLACVRDATFYTWRFLATPARCQDAFVILDGGTPIAVCALESSTDGRIVRIVDLVAVPGAWHRALRAIARHAADTTSASTLELKLMALDGRSRGLWRAGFTERQHKPFLCMIPSGGDRRFLDPDRWFYTGADADVDTTNG